jgi:uncharacterized protein (UPF0264 family)
MTKLIVSVRSASEAATACGTGADLIDIKEPRNGPLGAPDAATVAGVVRELAGKRPVSVALGELGERASGASCLPIDGGGISFAKIGLAGCTRLTSWITDWKAALQMLPASVHRVAVVYADWNRAAAPSPDEVIARAHEFGCAATLLDTWDKSHGGLLDHWTRDDVGEFVSDVHSRGMISVVAGSLDEVSITQLRPSRPDYFAVRGAVCNDGRTDAIDGTRVARLAALIQDQSGVGIADSDSIKA